MEHIRAIDVLRSAVIWAMALDVVLWALVVIIRFLEGGERRPGLTQWVLLALGLGLASVAITIIAFNAPIAWMVLLCMAFAAAQAGAVVAGRKALPRRFAQHP